MSGTVEPPKQKKDYVLKKALLVGINEYENPYNNLEGCLADVDDFGESLKFLGFPRTKIKTLANEQATTKGILSGLKKLTDGATAGDILVFYYSGHGSSVIDLDNDEEDHEDEILCPWDVSWNDKKYITDDQLYEAFTVNLDPGVYTDAIFDCCYSGTITRSIIQGVPEHSFMKKKRARWLQPPRDHLFRINSSIPGTFPKSKLGRAFITGDLQADNKATKATQNNVSLTAAQDYQTAVEYEMPDGQIRGAFTYLYCQLLRESRGLLTRAQMYSILRQRMFDEQLDQVPNIMYPNRDVLDRFQFKKESEINKPEEIKPKRKNAELQE